MKGPVQIIPCHRAALAGSNAFALGLGAIQVKSGLNQPLDAEIPVSTESPTEATELTVDLASAEDFERVGLNRTRVSMPARNGGVDQRSRPNRHQAHDERGRARAVDRFPDRRELDQGQGAARIHRAARSADHGATGTGTPATVAPVAEKPAAASQPLPTPKPAPPAESSESRTQASPVKPPHTVAEAKAKLAPPPAPPPGTAAESRHALDGRERLWPGCRRRNPVGNRPRNATG